jgi:hypothetical protein
MKTIQKTTTKKTHVSPLTLAEFASLGQGQVAYVRPILSDDVARVFPQADTSELQSGLQLFILLSADGSPILLTDSHDTATANAWAHDLKAVSVH